MRLKPTAFSIASAPKLLFSGTDTTPGADPWVSDEPSTSGRGDNPNPKSLRAGGEHGRTRHGHGRPSHHQIPFESCSSSSSWVWTIHMPYQLTNGDQAMASTAPPGQQQRGQLHGAAHPAAAAPACGGATAAAAATGPAPGDTLAAVSGLWRTLGQLQTLSHWLRGRDTTSEGILATAAACYSPGCTGGGNGRMMLLASLTTSAVAAAATAAGGAATATVPAGGRAGSAAGGAPASGGGSGGGGGAGGPGPGPAVGGPIGLWQGFHLPQLSIMRPPGSASFLEDQELAQELLDYHTAKNGAFPRPCPRCKSAEFLVRRGDSGADGGAEGDVVEWRSRPLRCETCGAWVHMRCAGVGLVEQVPPRPWFHSQACRDTYLRLEAAASHNPQPTATSPSHRLYLLTPADMAAYDRTLMRAAVAEAVLSAGGGGDGAALPSLSAAGPRARGPAAAVVPLLSQGFNDEAIQGFNEPSREYDGGKYSAVLVHRGRPVAAATFNVFGSDAQLCLLATGIEHRMQGHGAALVSELEASLASLGVSRVFVQARSVALPLWVRRLGYSLVHPAELPDLHSRLPLAYYDCPLLEKRLEGRGRRQGQQ